MSSKLMRGETIATEAVTWRRISSTELMAGEVPSDNAAEPEPREGEDPGPDTEALIASARQQGFEEGHTAATKSLSGELRAVQMQMARSIEELTGLRPRYRREAEQEVVTLALAVARRILHRELTVSPEALLGLVKVALDKIELREVHQARVAPAEAGMVRQFFEQLGAPQKVEVIADSSLAPGSVLIESAHGTLDASVDTQLAEIERGFADLAGGPS
jgi:flagellar assembly protein FliH